MSASCTSTQPHFDVPQRGRQWQLKANCLHWVCSRTNEISATDPLLEQINKYQAEPSSLVLMTLTPRKSARHGLRLALILSNMFPSLHCSGLTAHPDRGPDILPYHYPLLCLRSLITLPTHPPPPLHLKMLPGSVSSLWFIIIVAHTSYGRRCPFCEPTLTFDLSFLQPPGVTPDWPRSGPRVRAGSLLEGTYHHPWSWLLRLLPNQPSLRGCPLWREGRQTVRGGPLPWRRRKRRRRRRVV